MSGRRVVITSGKGGVGKTTVTANIGYGLASLGKKVALVDADIGLRNLDIILGMENRIVYDLVDVVEGNCKLRQALIRDRRLKTLQLLPAAQTRDKEAVSPKEMEALCINLGKEFDYVLIDCPAGIDRGFQNAVAGGEEGIVVTTPEVASIRDADRVVGLLEAAGLREPKLVVNKIRPMMVQDGNMLSIEDVLDILGSPLLGIVIDDPAVVIATNKGEPVLEIPQAKSAQCFRNMTRRLEGEEVPLEMHLLQVGFWRRLLARLGWRRG